MAPRQCVVMSIVGPDVLNEWVRISATKLNVTSTDAINLMSAIKKEVRAVVTMYMDVSKFDANAGQTSAIHSGCVALSIIYRA